jgi:endonuclease/exonuclease/phosphatase family metal-dependent hydrolase
MKILFLNAGYCMGFDGRKRNYLLKIWKNIYSGTKNLNKLELLAAQVKPDVLAMAEADAGSLRGNFTNQIETLERKLGFSSVFYKLKYSDKRLLKKLPTFRKQCNAILTQKEGIEFNTFYFKRGVKKLLIQAKLPHEIDFFLVHLPLGKRGRAKQLQELERVIRNSKKVIIAGDFNTFYGSDELEELMQKCNLKSANIENIPTFPSGKPAIELDFFLVSQEIKIKKFKVLASDVSDHLPILLEI